MPDYNSIFHWSYMVQRVIISAVILSRIVFAQLDTTRHFPNPVLKSVLLPGWGQLSYGENHRARTYLVTESLLWIATIGSRQISRSQKHNYIAFATEHAQVVSGGKDHQYWVDIGNFSNLDAYNAEHLRNRDIESLYPRGSVWDWTWDSNSNRSQFERMRIRSDLWKQSSTFLMGGIILNHFVSAIDALYLKRIRSQRKFSLNERIDPESGSPLLSLEYNF